MLTDQTAEQTGMYELKTYRLRPSCMDMEDELASNLH